MHAMRIHPPGYESGPRRPRGSRPAFTRPRARSTRRRATCLARIASTALPSAPRPSSTTPVLARHPDLASTRAAAGRPTVPRLKSDKTGHAGACRGELSGARNSPIPGRPRLRAPPRWYLCSDHRMAQGAVAAPAAGVALGFSERRSGPRLTAWRTCASLTPACRKAASTGCLNLANLRTASIVAVPPCFRDAAVPRRATDGR
jgi:hypothetical protein